MTDGAIELILDADALIKLHAVGILARVVEAFACAVPVVVSDEAVRAGSAKGHADAVGIDSALVGKVPLLPTRETERLASSLGSGEVAILALLAQLPEATVVSGDRRFLATLRRLGARFLTSSKLVLALQLRGSVSRDEAMFVLARLRPMIRPSKLEIAQRDLADGENGDD